MVVEAAGVEPDPGQFINVLMARDLRRKTLIPRRFSPSIESSGVPSRPLESTPVVETFWRRPGQSFEIPHVYISSTVTFSIFPVNALSPSA